MQGLDFIICSCTLFKAWSKFDGTFTYKSMSLYGLNKML